MTRFAIQRALCVVTVLAVNAVLWSPLPVDAQTCLEFVGGSIERAPFMSAVTYSDHLFVADAERRLRVFDISVPEAPEEVGSIRTSGHPIDVSIDGKYLVLTENDFATYVFDVSDPAAPVQRGQHVTPPAAQSVSVVGDRAYVANFSAGLTILDLSNPATPRRMSTLDTPGFTYGVAYTRDHAILGDLTGGLRVVDVSRPERPREVAFLPELRRASDLVTSNEIVYVAGGSDGIYMVDLTDPRTPKLLGAVRTSDTAQQRQVLAVDEDTLMVGDDHLWLFDISAPRQPKLVDSFELPVESDITGIAVSNNHVFVTGSASGFLVFDRTACRNPMQTRRASETAASSSLHLVEGNAGSGAGTSGPQTAQK